MASSFARFGRYLKDFWSVVIRGENDDLQRQIRSVEEQVQRLRERRIAQAKEREAAALNHARAAVKKMQELHQSLLAAEDAASEFASKLGEHAKKCMEAEMQVGEKTRMEFMLRQKVLFQQALKNEMEATSGGLTPQLLSELNEEVEASLQQKADDSLVSTPTTGKVAQKAESLKVVNLEDAGLASSQPSDQAEALLQSDATLANEHVVSFASDSKTEQAKVQQQMCADLEVIGAVSPSILEQLAGEVRKQADLEAEGHLEALSKQRECIQQELEARAEAEHVAVLQEKR